MRSGFLRAAVLVLAAGAGAAAAAMGVGAAGPDGPNLLLITIDTLRPDRLSCYDPKYVQTPFVDALAARSVLFEKAFAHTPTTLPSHADILLGTTPPFHGVSENSKARVADGFLTLAEHLKRAGYATGAFIGAFPLDARFGLGRGFDVYDDAFPQVKTGAAISLERRADQVAAPAMAWLAGRKGKWFCWIHLWDPHTPYLPPEPYASRFKDDPYSGEAAYVDEVLGRLFADLKARGWEERTLVVLTADHGEALGEHGEATHSYFAYNSTLHVPLLIGGPGIRAGRAGEYVQHIDIFPTVCDLLGVPRPGSPLQGESLAPLLRGKPGSRRPIYIESLEPYLNKGCAPVRGFIEEGRKFLDSPIPELYDLARDFGETKNLAPSEDLAPFRKKLQDLEKSLAGPGAKTDGRPADRRTLERLRSLGYVAASAVSEIKSAYGPEDDLKSFLPFEQKLERAVVQGGRGKADEGARLLEEIIRDKPNFGPAYTYLAEILTAAGRLREAVRAMEDGCRRNPKNYNLFAAYGTWLVQHGQWERAGEILQSALGLLDFDPDMWVDLGIVRMRQGALPEAVAAFDRALVLDRSFVPALINRGAAFLDLGVTKESALRAAEDFRAALAIRPELGLAWRGLGVASDKAGRADEAAAAWERAVAADPGDEFSTLALGKAVLAKGDKAKARACFERYLELRKAGITAAERAELQAWLDKCRDASGGTRG